MKSRNKAVVVLVVLLVVALAGCGRRQRPADAKPSPTELVASDERHDGVVYPYSIVPGGVDSRADVEAAARRDRVVAQHYREVDVRSLRPATLTGDKLMYVSYRRGDQVYWTRRAMRIPAGERVLSNGRDCIRGRCGNRLSETPRTPTVGESDREPLPGTLVTPSVRNQVLDELVPPLIATVFPAMPLPYTPGLPGYLETVPVAPASSTLTPPGGGSGVSPGPPPMSMGGGPIPPAFPLTPPAGVTPVTPPLTPVFPPIVPPAVPVGPPMNLPPAVLPPSGPAPGPIVPVVPPVSPTPATPTIPIPSPVTPGPGTPGSVPPDTTPPGSAPPGTTPGSGPPGTGPPGTTPPPATTSCCTVPPPQPPCCDTTTVPPAGVPEPANLGLSLAGLTAIILYIRKTR